jgi:hypothetical protein
VEGRLLRTTAVDLKAAYDALHLPPTAPPELVIAFYRRLTRLYHPDQGWEGAAMVRLNAAVACIRAHQPRADRRG